MELAGSKSLLRSDPVTAAPSSKATSTLKLVKLSKACHIYLAAL